jgi:hypothetical protein
LVEHPLTHLLMGIGCNMVYRDLIVYIKSLNAASVNANTSEEQAFTVTGLNATRDIIVAVSAANGAALAMGIGNARVSADDELSLTFTNPAITSKDANAQNFTIVVGRAGSDPAADGDRL